MPRTLPQPTVDSMHLDTMLSAVADPVRRSILRALYRADERTNCAVIAADLDVTAATVSHHWRVLREAGFTSTTVEGRGRVVTLRRDEVEQRFPGLLAAVLTSE